MASSRVGVSIKVRIGLGPFFCKGFCDNRCKMGIAKAAVLPVPVWAQPCKSLPFINIGIAFSWIGVGLMYPSPLRSYKELPRPEIIIKYRFMIKINYFHRKVHKISKCLEFLFRIGAFLINYLCLI